MIDDPKNGVVASRINLKPTRKARSSGRHIVDTVSALDTDIDGAQIRHSQLSCGSFLGEVQRITLKDATLDSGLFNQNLSGTGKLSDNSYTLFFIPSVQGGGHLNKVNLVPGIWIYQPGEEIYGTIPTDFQWFGLTIGRDAIEKRLESIGIDPAGMQNLGTGPIAAQKSLKCLQDIIWLLYMEGHSAGEFGHAELLEESLVLAFIDAIGAKPVHAKVHKRIHPVLQRATDLLTTHLDRPVTITELCRHLGCSRRQVEHLFKDIYGLGPALFHRKMRLNGARRQLLEGDRRPNAVSAAAQNFGFTHLGRFSADYRKLFGELPRHTAHCNSRTIITDPYQAP